MVYRIYVEKKRGFDHEAMALTKEARELLELHEVEDIRVINRYDVEGVEKELFDYSVNTVFSEPQMDSATESINTEGARVFAVEYLPGQFDQRADSAAQCIQLISKCDRPAVRTAKVYAVYGNVSDETLMAIKKFVINPVESREASLDKPMTLKAEYDIPSEVSTLDGFLKLDRQGLEDFVKAQGLLK